MGRCHDHLGQEDYSTCPVVFATIFTGKVFFMAKKINYAELYTLRADGRYQASYTDATGRHYLYHRDPKELHRRLEEKLTRKDEPHIPTWREVAGEWERQHREEIETRTWKNYAPHLADMLSIHGDKPYCEVTALDVSNDLMTAKARGYSATVVKTRRSIYRMIGDFAVVHGYAQYNPVASVKLPKGLKHGKRVAPTSEQMQIICGHIDAPFGLFPFFLLCTGLRKSEALALRWEDVDFEAREISIEKSLDYTVGSIPKYKPPKTEAGYRTVPILDILMEPLQEALAQSRSELLFPAPASNRGGKGGGLMTDRAYEGAWQRYCEATGLIDEDGKAAITAHNLRHGTATLMFELGVDELTAQKILGHSRIEITREIYTDLRKAQKLKSIKKFNRGMSKVMSTAKKP